MDFAQTLLQASKNLNDQDFSNDALAKNQMIEVFDQSLNELNEDQEALRCQLIEAYQTLSKKYQLGWKAPASFSCPVNQVTIAVGDGQATYPENPFHIVVMSLAELDPSESYLFSFATPVPNEVSSEEIEVKPPQEENVVPSTFSNESEITKRKQKRFRWGGGYGWQIKCKKKGKQNYMSNGTQKQKRSGLDDDALALAPAVSPLWQLPSLQSRLTSQESPKILVTLNFSGVNWTNAERLKEIGDIPSHFVSPPRVFIVPSTYQGNLPTSAQARLEWAGQEGIPLETADSYFALIFPQHDGIVEVKLPQGREYRIAVEAGKRLSLTDAFDNMSVTVALPEEYALERGSDGF